MKKDLVKLAIVGVLAGFCLSAQGSSCGSDGIAMSKCSKDSASSSKAQKSQDQGASDMNGSNGNSGCNDSDGYENGDQQSDAAQTMQTKRKSAAQKVVEGE